MLGVISSEQVLLPQQQKVIQIYVNMIFTYFSKMNNFLFFMGQK